MSTPAPGDNPGPNGAPSPDGVPDGLDDDVLEGGEAEALPRDFTLPAHERGG